MFWKIHIGTISLSFLFGVHLEVSMVSLGSSDSDKTVDDLEETSHRWPGYPGKGDIPFVIDPSLASLEPIIFNAMDIYNNLTCIKFIPRTDQPDYVDITPGECDAPVGRLGGRQALVLGPGCEHLGNILHELGHAIGLDDQHKRSDRDLYITINDRNIKEGNQHYFTKNKPSKDTLSTPYDFKSIMHQGNYYKSKSPGSLKTLEAMTGEKLLELNEKFGITSTDIDMIQYLYKC
ncbi:hypothetical protein JTE90_014750 [Oedothorax gibbosus]|uniref:Metalloendopeptidase n=1 Tax=Oedothorax gibbosus TaxID=931172 RepID=A0AAV6UR55_9ARAC|nr:hypothetical protein JTE90_014750 [Oedothorax gibbosus]